MKILVVEDEDTIREVVAAYLNQAGFTTMEAEDGEKALELLDKNSFDLIVLDLNLPKVDGIEVCKTVRKTSKIPIIMLTARVEEIDELIGLESGADDYVKKPFKPSVLVARIKALLRRTKSSEEKIKVGELIIDPEKMKIKKNEDSLEFTTTQFNILYTLAKEPGKVFTRDKLLDSAYDSSLPPDILDRTIDAHIKAIRKKIEENTRKPKYILTVIGKGYKFSEEV
ncbi:response regulator [Candidatus Dojkabacteria bacterium]|nr:response regulator [Candidatus Dojkabacteria bacterium]